MHAHVEIRFCEQCYVWGLCFACVFVCHVFVLGSGACVNVFV